MIATAFVSYQCDMCEVTSQAPEEEFLTGIKATKTESRRTKGRFQRRFSGFCPLRGREKKRKWGNVESESLYISCHKLCNPALAAAVLFICVRGFLFEWDVTFTFSHSEMLLSHCNVLWCDTKAVAITRLGQYHFIRSLLKCENFHFHRCHFGVTQRLRLSAD